MKPPTPAAWRKMLGQYEEIFNQLRKEALTDEELDALFLVHDVLRLRASGGKADE